MMKPLNRKMFRDPRAAKRATGILASSSPLMTAAQKAMMQGQPVKAQVGTSVNTQNRTILQDLARLPVDVRSGLGQIFSNVSLPATRTSSPRTMPVSTGKGQPISPPTVMTPQQRARVSAAQQQEAINRMGGPRYDSGPFFQIGDVNLGNMFSDGSPLDIFRTGPGSPPMAGQDPGETSTFSIRKAEREAAERQATQDRLDAGIGTKRPSVDFMEQRVLSERPDLLAAAIDQVSEGGGEAVSNSAPVSAAPGVDPGEDAGLDAGFVPKPKPKVSKTEAAVMPETVRPESPYAPEEATSDTADLKPATVAEIKGSRDSDSTVAPEDGGTAKEERGVTAEDLLNTPGSMMKGGTDAEKADAADEAAGIKGTLKEKVQQRLELQRELFGDRIDIRNDANYAAMMFGLALATGDSGDLKTDLAEAGKTLLQMKGKANAEERALFAEQASTAMNSVLASEEAEAQRKATRENLSKQLSSSEQIALMRDGTQRAIAAAGISAEDRRLAANIENRNFLAEFNATNQFKLAAAKMDADTRLAALSAKTALDRAVLSADTQKQIAEYTQTSLNNRLDTQIEADIAKLGEDSAEVKRLKFLKANPQIQDMLIDIAKKSKGNTNNFKEELALKLAGNQSLMMFQGGAEALFATMSSLAEGVTPVVNIPTEPINIEDIDEKARKQFSDMEDGNVFLSGGLKYKKEGNQLIPVES